jgi:hypothetical protein
MRHLKWIVLFVVLLSLAVAPTTFAAPASPSGQCGYSYQVRWGDTLNSIARYTGVSAWAIAQANGLVNPNYIYPVNGCGFRANATAAAATAAATTAAASSATTSKLRLLVPGALGRHPELDQLSHRRQCLGYRAG